MFPEILVAIFPNFRRKIDTYCFCGSKISLGFEKRSDEISRALVESRSNTVKPPVKAMLHEAIFLATSNATKKPFKLRRDVTRKQLVSQRCEK